MLQRSSLDTALFHARACRACALGRLQLVCVHAMTEERLAGTSWLGRRARGLHVVYLSRCLPTVNLLVGCLICADYGAMHQRGGLSFAQGSDAVDIKTAGENHFVAWFQGRAVGQMGSM